MVYALGRAESARADRRDHDGVRSAEGGVHPRGQFEIAVQPSIWPGQLTLPITPSPRRSGRMYRAIQFVGALVHSHGS
jgi:hypothetical protein